MALIYETKNFIVESAEKPHVDRNDGGHIRIVPKVKIIDRQELTAEQAIEFTRLTMVVGQAMSTAMSQRGADIGRINYHDMGNWSVFEPEGPYFHLHVYGRAKSAKIQKYGDSVYLPQRKEQPEFYKNFKSLNEEDVKEIKKEIEKLFKEDKYSDQEWRLS